MAEEVIEIESDDEGGAGATGGLSGSGGAASRGGGRREPASLLSHFRRCAKERDPTLEPCPVCQQNNFSSEKELRMHIEWCLARASEDGGSPAAPAASRKPAKGAASKGAKRTQKRTLVGKHAGGKAPLSDDDLTHPPPCPPPPLPPPKHAPPALPIPSSNGRTQDEPEGGKDIATTSASKLKPGRKTKAGVKSRRNLKLESASTKHGVAHAGSMTAGAVVAQTRDKGLLQPVAVPGADGDTASNVCSEEKEAFGGSRLTKRTVTSFFRTPAAPDALSPTHDETKREGEGTGGIDLDGSGRWNKRFKGAKETGKDGCVADRDRGGSLRGLHKLIGLCVPAVPRTDEVLAPWVHVLFSSTSLSASLPYLDPLELHSAASPPPETRGDGTMRQRRPFDQEDLMRLPPLPFEAAR